MGAEQSVFLASGWINLILLGVVFALFFWGFSTYARTKNKKSVQEIENASNVAPKGLSGEEAIHLVLLMTALSEEIQQPLNGLEIIKVE